MTELYWTKNWAKGFFDENYRFDSSKCDCFDGSKYANVIDKIFGINIRNLIKPEVAIKMNPQIQSTTWEIAKDNGFKYSKEEWKSFQKMWNDNSIANNYLITDPTLIE